MKKVKTKQGIKIYDGEKHIKTIPAKYLNVVGRLTFSDDKIRLNNTERLFLEAELIRDGLKDSSDRTEQLAAEQIEGAICTDCVAVTTKKSHWVEKELVYKKRYALIFSNNKRITCGKHLHKYGTGATEFSLY